MAYKLIVTKHADDLLDSLVCYLLFRLKNEQAASHLLNGIKNIYDRLEENPLQFAYSSDTYLARKGYREAIVPQMDYVVIFSIKENDKLVIIAGIFHLLENYQEKISFPTHHEF